MKVKLVLVVAAALATALWPGLWSFPAMLLAAFLVAWGAEAAQFLISQGLALAALAWLQTLPELAVEAVIAWRAGHDGAACFAAHAPAGCHARLAIANFTGAVRLLVGLGWPMIYFVSAAARRRHGEAHPLQPLVLAPAHAIEVGATVPALLYFTWIWYKGSLSLADGAVLLALYALYLAALWRQPTQARDALADAPRVAQWAYRRRPPWRAIVIVILLVSGGGLIYLSAPPFLASLLALAGAFGVSRFVFVQWVAPFVSEFPEKVSAFYWAARVRTAPMALMNLLSSNVNQWTVLAATIPVVLSLARGSVTALPLDAMQRDEIRLTLLQSGVAVLLLAHMRLHWRSAALLFVLWLVQFAVADWRNAVALCYALWALSLIGSWAVSPPTAPRLLWGMLRGRAVIPDSSG